LASSWRPSQCIRCWATGNTKACVVRQRFISTTEQGTEVTGRLSNARFNGDLVGVEFRDRVDDLVVCGARCKFLDRQFPTVGLRHCPSADEDIDGVDKFAAAVS